MSDKAIPTVYIDTSLRPKKQALADIYQQFQYFNQSSALTQGGKSIDAKTFINPHFCPCFGSLILFTLFSFNTFAQDYMQWGLPEGAKPHRQGRDNEIVYLLTGLGSQLPVI